MVHHAPPKFLAPEFDCPLCGVYSKQNWLDVPGHYPAKVQIDGKELRIAQCTRCNKLTFWVDGRMLPAGSKSPGDLT
ncbi:MAG TPA: hypothetical protein VEF34_07915 [Syntrophobacteraceae bacterium]|nr:hypothetical protein [Syntrophobacteraceae bacterium]